MMTRNDLAEFSRAHEDDLVLSVYIARQSSDPGSRGRWRLRLDGALGAIRSSLEQEGSVDLPAFDRASRLVMADVDAFGRVLPAEGWAAFATEERLSYAEELPFAPAELARWRQGVYAAPYVRAFKSGRPVVAALVDRWHAHLHAYLDGDLSEALVLATERETVEASDVGMSKRASTSSGMRGTTGADYTQRIQDEDIRRLRGDVGDALVEMAGDHGSVVLGGTQRAIKALHKELEEKLPGRVLEVPELSFDDDREELSAAVGHAASALTRMRQSRLLDACAASSDRGCLGWNGTYRALAAGAVDTLLLARDLIESSPDDAERLVRLALAQGAEVEELGEELGGRLMAESDGAGARLRFRLVS